MPSRNEPCPCGSGAKHKRCCLLRLEGAARELREREALLAVLVDWLRAEHAATLEDAGRETTLIRMLRGSAARSMSMVWAINDFTPTDGGLPLMTRFASRTDLDPPARDLARGLAEARLGVYRVGAGIADVWVELEPLAGGAAVRILSGGDLTAPEVGDIVVARVVHATSTPSLWGTAARFAPETERRWRARLAELPADRASQALTVLGFHPDNAAEPLPRGLHMVTAAWSIVDDDAVLELLEDDPLFECIGEAMPSGWAFSWLADVASGRPDLGGWQEGDGRIEVARVVVTEHEATLVSADRETLHAVTLHLRHRLHGCIAPLHDTLAA